MAKLKLGQTSAANDRDGLKAQSIRSKILRRFLPVLLLPLLLLGAISIVGIFLIQQRTSDAVESAEEILSERVVEDGVARSAERGSRELADYVSEWFARVERLNGRSAFRESLVETSNATRDAGFVVLEGEELTTALEGPVTRRSQVLALTAVDELQLEEDNVQVLLVSEDGLNLGSSHDTTLSDYGDDEWFTQTRDNGFSFRSFVDDGEHEPSFELATWTEPPATTSGGALVRVRVPLTNVQRILDELAGDDAVEVALVDSSFSVLLADTLTDHSAEFLFDAAQLAADGSGLNTELFVPGVVQTGGTVTAARRVSDSLDPSSALDFNWLVQSSQPFDVAGSSLTEIRAVSTDVTNQRSIFVFVVVSLLLTALVIGFFLVRSVANQITAPVQQLSDQARAAAEDGIPAVVQAARSSEELPDLDPFEVETNDELAILAHSLNTMQDAAVDLAAGQAKLRRQNVARTFVSLGRRNQNLLNRQLEFIDELERQESDADALENLFRLDHLATRMRRNAENLLVLAGEQTPRRWAKPIAIRDVLRAAAAEIADYRRVRLGDIDPATVSGNLATDLSHLIAELLENAGSFSPPNTPVEVLGQHTATHYRLAIVDQGIGMDPAALVQVNDRLKNPVDFADAPSAYLGLFVVGRLSQELGITVRLASADPTGEGRRRGTIAFIDLPVSLLSSEAATAIEIDERTLEGVAKREPIPTPESRQAPTETAANLTAPVSAQAETPKADADSPAVTAAGFPKRRSSRGAGQAADAAPASEPAAAAAPAQPVAESPTPTPPPTEITAAGFPKRRSAATSPAPAPAPIADTPDQPAETPKRDAAEVSNSLRSFRAAVARGRASGPAPSPEAGSAASMMPPPLPSDSAAAPTPESAEPSNPSADQIDEQPNPSGSQS
ncbi:MAG: HAMP domain-containing protein [Acidimicrobiia bacterium]|nr:HAMP domain-containing protein [Acidimicrobiia bacterium]